MQAGAQLAEGRYVLERLLKRTGMAEVWVASQRGSGGFSKPVVIKMIHPDLNEQREARDRFFDEAQLASQIHHPHVVQIYDFGQQDQSFYLAMEFIEGYDIEAIVAHARDTGQAIPIHVICRLIADACQGLGYIHDLQGVDGSPLGLVHRDISPQNLVVSRSGVIKIIDFGVVKARQKSSRTRTGVIVGKLQYMSPEQLSSEELDRRSDIYALGLVLYELLLQKPRFRGSNLLEIFYEALNEPPPNIIDVRPDCSPALVRCVHQALAQKREERFADAYAMQEALEQVLRETGASSTHRQIATYLSGLFSGGHDDEGGADVLDETTRIERAMVPDFERALHDEVVLNEGLMTENSGFGQGPLDGGPHHTFSSVPTIGSMRRNGVTHQPEQTLFQNSKPQHTLHRRTPFSEHTMIPNAGAMETSDYNDSPNLEATALVAMPPEGMEEPREETVVFNTHSAQGDVAQTASFSPLQRAMSQGMVARPQSDFAEIDMTQKHVSPTHLAADAHDLLHQTQQEKLIHNVSFERSPSMAAIPRSPSAPQMYPPHQVSQPGAGLLEANQTMLTPTVSPRGSFSGAKKSASKFASKQKSSSKAPKTRKLPVPWPVLLAIGLSAFGLGLLVVYFLVQ